MLDEDEYLFVTSLLESGHGPRELRPHRMLEEYNRITGQRETNVNAVYHHRVALYGPACAHCGKPLRTPRAKLCGHCMKPAPVRAN